MELIKVIILGGRTLTNNANNEAIHWFSPSPLDTPFIAVMT